MYTQRREEEHGAKTSDDPPKTNLIRRTRKNEKSIGEGQQRLCARTHMTAYISALKAFGARANQSRID